MSGGLVTTNLDKNAEGRAGSGLSPVELSQPKPWNSKFHFSFKAHALSLLHISSPAHRAFRAIDPDESSFSRETHADHCNAL